MFSAASFRFREGGTSQYYTYLGGLWLVLGATLFAGFPSGSNLAFGCTCIGSLAAFATFVNYYSHLSALFLAIAVVIAQAIQGTIEPYFTFVMQTYLIGFTASILGYGGPFCYVGFFVCRYVERNCRSRLANGLSATTLSDGPCSGAGRRRPVVVAALVQIQPVRCRRCGSRGSPARIAITGLLWCGPHHRWAAYAQAASVQGSVRRPIGSWHRHRHHVAGSRVELVTWSVVAVAGDSLLSCASRNKKHGLCLS